MMRNIISKELFREIIGEDFNVFEVTGNCITYGQDETTLKYIDVLSLYFRCKEWAMTKSYQVETCRPIVQDDEGKAVINYWYKAYIFKFELGTYRGPEQILNFDVSSESEPEAIFAACEWILTEIKKN